MCQTPLDFWVQHAITLGQQAQPNEFLCCAASVDSPDGAICNILHTLQIGSTYRYPDAGRETASELELEVELPLGEKSARQSQNLVGFAQLSNFALQRFYPVALGAGNAIAHANVDLMFTDPIMQGLRNTIDLGRNGFQWMP